MTNINNSIGVHIRDKYQIDIQRLQWSQEIDDDYINFPKFLVKTVSSLIGLALTLMEIHIAELLMRIYEIKALVYS